MRLLACDSHGNPVWETWEDLAAEIDAVEVSLWAKASGADDYFDEPTLSEGDKKANRELHELRGRRGFDPREAVDVKAWSRLSEWQRMVASLSLAHSLDPGSLMQMDYVFLRGMLARANMNAREAEQRARDQARR